MTSAHTSSHTSDTSRDTHAIEERTALRREVLAIRRKLDEAYRAHKSAEICKRLIQSLDMTLMLTDQDPSQAIIAVYSAFPDEVQLHDFIQNAYEQGCSIAFPVIVQDAHSDNDTQQTMEMRLVDQMTYESIMQVDGSGQYIVNPTNPYHQAETPESFLANPLKTYQHNDPMLADFPYVRAQDLTMIVVPLVAFDKQGNRLGYGGGNYDRYLTQIQSDTRVAAVAFAEQQVDEVPIEQHDIRVPIIAL